MRLNGYQGSIAPRAGMLFEDGKTDYAILIPEGASESVRFAAKELTDIFAKAGVLIETATDAGLSADPAAKFISLGKTVYFDSLGVKMTQAEYKFDGFLIESVGETYVVCGVGDTGTCFGAYGFAEYAMGWVYYAEDEFRIDPRGQNLEFHIRDIPSFLGRYAFSTYTSHNMDHAFRLRVNGEFAHREPRHGEGTPWSKLSDQSMCFDILDWRIYEKNHPDWYYRHPDWKTLPKPRCYPQFCYAKGLYDRECFDTFVENLIERFIKPESSRIFFLLGISDNYYFCDCPACTREAEKYGRSGLSLRFVNKVADAVEEWRKKNAPERVIYILTFAYKSTFDAPVKEEDGKLVPVDPSVVARDNVLIRYAPIDANFLYPVMDPVMNPRSRRSLLGWQAVAKHLSVWDYRQDFGTEAFPYPSLATAGADLDSYYGAEMLDVFNQAQHWCIGSPFIAMDDFARARMHWNMNERYEELIDEFRDAYYREAAPFVLEYQKAVEASYPLWVSRGWSVDRQDRAALHPEYYRVEEMRAFGRILDRALEAAGKIADPAVRKKVILRVETLTVFYKAVLAICLNREIEKEEALALIAELRDLTERTGLIYFMRRTTAKEYLDEAEAIVEGRLSPADRKCPLFSSKKMEKSE